MCPHNMFRVQSIEIIAVVIAAFPIDPPGSTVDPQHVPFGIYVEHLLS